MRNHPPLKRNPYPYHAFAWVYVFSGSLVAFFLCSRGDFEEACGLKNRLEYLPLTGEVFFFQLAGASFTVL